MKKYFPPLLILLGIFLGFIFPFYALALSKWTFIFLFLLLTINIFPINFTYKDFTSIKVEDFYFIFIAYGLIPSIIFLIGNFLYQKEFIAFSFFLTSLAPIAIIAPQFINDNENKKIAVRHIVISTFLFPIIFSCMLWLFYPQSIRLNIETILFDSVIITALPIFCVFTCKKFFPTLNGLPATVLKTNLSTINMLFICLLSFIFVGSAYLKNNFNYFTLNDFILIFTLAVFQDFGSYLIAKLTYLDHNYQKILSIKNVPFIGIFALTFFPKALIAIVSILNIHIFMIIFLTYVSNKEMNSLD